ncbi:PrgI family protein [Candidatus Peregrinibacteria bacterium]|nr:PrgI family protein [Candidatus Peregrinibacteria bacterium]
MQFKVPQDVQREDTIVGPLTLRQLIICGIGGGISYTLYLLLAKIYFIEIWLPPVIFISLITVAFAFVKIHNLTFLRFLMMSILFNFLPKKRNWQKLAADILPLNEPQQIIKKEKKQKIHSKRPSMSELENLTKILDSHGLQKS